MSAEPPKDFLGGFFIWYYARIRSDNTPEITRETFSKNTKMLRNENIQAETVSRRAQW
jgi:hypothetical protein